jgi:ATP-binding cassette subfamily B multidrug efflux pump
MLKMLRYMKTQWKTVIAIIVLLFVQAICDLSLPTYTSNLIDVGIQNSGVEFATPTVIRAQEYQKVQLFMTEDEKTLWNAAYEQGSDGNFHIKDESRKNMQQLDDTFTHPILITYMLSHMSTDQQVAAASTTEAGGTPDYAAIRSSVEDKMQSMGETMLHSSAVAYAKEEYTAVGKDLNQMQTAYLWKIGGVMIGMALLMAVSAVLVGLLASRVGAGVGRDLREQVFNRVVGFSHAEINHFSTASLITRSTNDIQQMQLVSTMLLRMVFYAPILAIGGLIMVVRTGAGMTWIIALAVLTILCVVGVLMVVAMPKFKLMQKLVDKVNLVSREILTGLSVIRAFGREEQEEKRFDEANRDLTRTMLFTNRAMTFMMPLMMIIMNLISVLIVWVSANHIDAGTLEVGTMTAFITYTMQIVMSFLMICMMSVMIPRAAVAADRINEVLNTEPVINDRADAMAIDQCHGVVAFHHVSFRYPGADGNALTDIDFEARPGQTTAIIGSTGSGKSTLVQLIPRLYDVTDGSVTIDGMDVRDVTQASLRDQIGMVPQKGVLFSGTIASNIGYGAEQLSDEQMQEAANIAQATEFIEEKSEGYQSPIAQGGSNVSGGQKQRLSIARAIAKNPRIYIFDDSFSALDFKTDAALRQALAPKIKDSTVFIVAQRISTILYADQILVLDDGHLVGKGTHAELMKSCPTYQQIARSQLSEEELAQNSGKEDTDHE